MTVRGCYSLQMKSVFGSDIRQAFPEAKKGSEAENGGSNSSSTCLLFTKIYLVDQEDVDIPLGVLAWTFLFFSFVSVAGRIWDQRFTVNTAYL